MKCTRCGGSGHVFVETGVVQGQDYGPETEGYHETCPRCGGSGETPAPNEDMNQTQFDLARIAAAQNL